MVTTSSTVVACKPEVEDAFNVKRRRLSSTSLNVNASNDSKNVAVICGDSVSPMPVVTGPVNSVPLSNSTPNTSEGYNAPLSSNIASNDDDVESSSNFFLILTVFSAAC